MKRWRLVVTLLAVLAWGLSAPLAVAADNCMAMGATCEGPCGASSCAVSGPDGVAYVRSPMPATPQRAEHVSQAALRVAEPPPKPALRSA